MLKTVSSIANAIGALNYKGTWDANANSPALTSSVGTKGDYYVVGTAGTTSLNGISNWGIGDWAVFNGSVWQRVEGGADLNGVNLSVSGTSTLSALTASTALALNASKQVVSVTNTGTGNNVLASNVNVISPNLLTFQGVNEKCYALTGWNFAVAFGGGSSMVMGTAAPTNFAPLSITVTATGVSFVYGYDATSAATIQSSCARASAGESFTASARAILNSGSAGVSGIQLDFYNAAGTLISSSARATINSASFDLITATGTAPSLTAYVGIQFYAEVISFNFCDCKLYRN